MKFRFVSIGLAAVATTVMLSCASSGSKSNGACDSTCESLKTSMDASKVCANKDLVCEGTRNALSGGKACTGFGASDGMCLSVLKGLSADACYNNDPSCDSVKNAIAADKPCPAKDEMCLSLRSAGFSVDAAKKFEVKK